MIKTTLLLLSACLGGLLQSDDLERTRNLPEFRLGINAEIPGAPELHSPNWLSGTQQAIRTEKHGLIYPAFFDWNKDGKKDLLLGEFETGQEGSYIKVYLNQGSAKAPSFSGEYFYATDIEGNKLTNYQWCCIGIHPRIVDLDNDGHLDILSGQYNPGKISWWRGSDTGFLPRVFVPQEAFVENARLAIDAPPWSPKSNSYWNYTTADFADLNGDGLLDLFVGGSGGLRFALNTGTKSEPRFGLRQDLLHLDGRPLRIAEVPDEEIKQMADSGRYANLTGVWKTYIKPIDWNSDGVLDLIVTHEYSEKSHHPIEYFEGVNTNHGLRFKSKQPLLTEAHNAKLFPGCQPMISICDFNDDGVNDMLVGLSIPTINGFEFASEIGWKPIKSLGLQMPGKDAGRALKHYGGLDETIKKLEAPDSAFLKKYLLGNLDDTQYLTLRHRGHVFVMLGKPPKTSAPQAQVQTAQPIVKRMVIKNETTARSSHDGPVSYSVSGPKRIKHNKTHKIEVTLRFQEGWFGYVNSPSNIEAGHIPTTVTFELPEEFERVGDPVGPKDEVYLRGDQITFSQEFRYRVTRDMDFSKILEKASIKVIIKYQTCNDQTCLPPVTHEPILESNVVFR